MSRREILVLICRALAIIEFVAAFESLTYLPVLLMRALREASLTGQNLATTEFNSYYFDLERVDLFALVL
ncbi:MAG TPA: hypothetical protein VGS41_17170, partial [Chthonomonadales bacterium]|nr:hypothetical protein [Chthonomonadales bacterium]